MSSRHLGEFGRPRAAFPVGKNDRPCRYAQTVSGSLAAGVAINPGPEEMVGPTRPMAGGPGLPVHLPVSLARADPRGLFVAGAGRSLPQGGSGVPARSPMWEKPFVLKAGGSWFETSPCLAELPVRCRDHLLCMGLFAILSRFDFSCLTSREGCEFTMPSVEPEIITLLPLP